MAAEKKINQQKSPMRGFFRLTALFQLLLACWSRACNDADGFTVKWATYLKNHVTACFRKQSVVSAHAYVGASMKFCATLAYQDVASNNKLTTEFFNAKSF
jgi:hypothetical protein